MPRDGSAIVAERFGENLRRVRRRAGLSQERLAKQASLHRTEVGLLEGGRRTCRIDTLIQLAGAMGARPEELLEGIGWIPGPEAEGIFTTLHPSPASHPAIEEPS